MRRPLAGSPFQPEPELEPRPADYFSVGDRVCHDKHGMGRVTAVDTAGYIRVDFGAQVLKTFDRSNRSVDLL